MFVINTLRKGAIRNKEQLFSGAFTKYFVQILVKGKIIIIAWNFFFSCI